VGDKEAASRYRVGTRFVTCRQDGTTAEIAVGQLSDEESLGWQGKVQERLPGAGAHEEYVLAIAGVPGAVPRRMRTGAGVADPTAERRIAAIIQAGGLRVRRPRVTGRYRVDLDGNGKDEEIVIAQRPRTLSTGSLRRQPFYAVALLGVSTPSGYRYTPLASTILPKGGLAAEQTYSLLGCADANGDGKMEVVLKADVYEGITVRVFTFDGRSPRKVLECYSGV
jgi:hypothetical protein